jgi:hypothetical protein
MRQALGVLRELSFTDSKITSAKEALAVALAEPENEALREANNSFAAAAILPDDKMIVSRADYAELVGALQRYHRIVCANAIDLDCDAAIDKAHAALAKWR